MSETPAISIVIPLYNKEPHIARALNSVLAQTFQDFEVVIVDDGSTDNSAEVVKKFEDFRIRLIQQENRGVSVARNRGIEAARAELIAFLDADDEWLPQHLETIMCLRSKFPKAGAYATLYSIQHRERIKKVDIPCPSLKSGDGLIPRYFKLAAECDPITSSSVCIPRSIFDSVGLFTPDVWWGEDTEMWGRIALHYDIAFSMKECVIYHYGATNRANERVKVERDHPFIKVGLEHIDDYHKVMSVTEMDDLKEYIESLKIKVAERALKSGRPDIAREMVLKCKTSRQLRWKMMTYFMSFLPPSVYQNARAIKWGFRNNSQLKRP
jgi:glycosyltransferase involved in cell wall biosynthesis